MRAQRRSSRCPEQKKKKRKGEKKKKRKGERKKLAKRDAGSESDIRWVEEIWVSSYNFWALG